MWSLVVVGVLLTVGLTACSSVGDEGETTAAASRGKPSLIPRARFERESKAICAASQQEINDGINALYAQRAKETGEPEGIVGTVEAIRLVVVPSLQDLLRRLEAVGLPEDDVYEAEAMWQTLRTITHEVEAEGIYAWRSAKLLPPFRNRSKQFGLQQCVVN
jgi:hypothetical protein